MPLKPRSEDDGAVQSVSSHKTKSWGIQRQVGTITVCHSFGFVTDVGSRPLLLIGYFGRIFGLCFWSRFRRGFGRWEGRSFPAIAE